MRRSHTTSSQTSRVSRKGNAKCKSTDVTVDKGEKLKFKIEFLTRLCEAIDTPRSLTVYLLAKHNEWEQYLELSFPDPLLPSFPDDLLVTEILSKDPTLETSFDTKKLALLKFFESEKLCKETNERFRSYYNEPSKSWDELHRILRVQEIISSALGPLTRNTLDRLESEFRFGPGATSSVSGRYVLPSRKYVSRMDTTPRLLPFIKSFSWFNLADVSLRSASKVITVPKNAKIDRTICIEPHLNVFIQLGVGSVLKSKLTRLGLAPNDQERNRQFARESIEHGYATIDLSMASDTIAFEVVSNLLPDDWLQLLYVCRTDFATLDQNDIRLEKWSSMGNGYTWELESLIFYAIARSLTDKPIAVFGDDLVVPIDIVDELHKLLNFFGFKMNERKSFWQGPFRESCGTDWWFDLDVRPIYLKDQYERSRPISHIAISYANKLRIYSHRRGSRVYCDRRFIRAWLYAKRRAFETVRTFASYGSSDDGIVCNFDEAAPSRDRNLWSWRSVVFKRNTKRSTDTSELGAYLLALHRGSPTDSRLIETARGRVLNPRTEVVLVDDWYNLGPWL